MNTKSEQNKTGEGYAPRVETGEGLKGVSWDDYWSLKARAEALAEALRELFKQCAMVHKYWGEDCNQQAADAAVTQACKALANWEGAQ